MDNTPAIVAVEDTGIAHQVVHYGRARTVEESAELQGIETAAMVKTLVVRRSENDFLFVLVSGDRFIDWAKLRGHLGVSRISLPDAEEAKAVTGYERGTITPFGSSTQWPIVMDERLSGSIAIGAGAHGVSIHIDADDLARHFNADRADVTK
ncbi:MAG: YbaK/EbsC family protein [Acidimicrobiia bacterium]|nr:YbaK/EbsC family protein [Acidimicrobiia bacterium]